MKRLSAIIAVGALTLGIAGIASAATATQTGTFTHSVGNIVQFITSDETNKTNATNIDTWDVDIDAGGSPGTVDRTDTVILFRLVANMTISLTGSFVNAAATQNGALAQTVSAGKYEFLQTWANICSDGSAAVGSGDTPTLTAHETGRKWSGIATAVAADGTNKGLATGAGYDTNYNFAYIGGSSATATALTPVTASPATYTSSGAFLNTGGTSVTYVEKDGATKFRVTVRAFNGEDFGDASNSTEAPDPGSFATTLTLTATYTP